MNSLTIKNLAIAIEALSRVPGYEDICIQLRYTINKELEEPKPKPKLDPDEDIPF